MKIEVEKLIYGGDGLARVDGEVIVTPFVAAGETAEIEREPKRSGITRGRLGALLSPLLTAWLAPHIPLPRLLSAFATLFLLSTIWLLRQSYAHPAAAATTST